MARFANGAAALRCIRSSTEPESRYVLVRKHVRSRCNTEDLGNIHGEAQISAQLPEELPRFMRKPHFSWYSIQNIHSRPVRSKDHLAFDLFGLAKINAYSL